jgi:two-component sensor histidine kinase
LILNSVKHGLNGNSGRLRVRLLYLPNSSEAQTGKTLDYGWAQLQVADTGPGLPADLDVTKTKSMGLRLVNMLVRQLRGRLEIGHPTRAKLSVSVPLESQLHRQHGESK